MEKKQRVLKEEYQELADAFESYTEYYGKCSCRFVIPPCTYCTHPGRPGNLENTDEAWEYVE